MNYDIKMKPFIINDNFDIEYNNWNKIDRSGNFYLGETSEVLQKTGLSKRKIYIDKSKLLKIINKHPYMNDIIIKKIPLILDKPIIIFKSQTIKDRIVIFGEICDHNNNPILVVIELNPYDNEYTNEKIYKVASAYSKTNKSSIIKWLSNIDNILYISDKKRINNWLNGLGLHLPVPFNNIDSFNNIISYDNNKNNIMIKDIPQNERPRERAIKYGIENLSNEELISIILKTGTKNHSVKDLSQSILSNIKDIYDLKNYTINSLTNINGIGKVKAIELLTAIELGKRVYYKVEKDIVKLNSSNKIYEYFKDIFIDEKQENFYAIYLDSKSNLISYKLLFKGTINTSCVHPREVFKFAVLESAYSIVVMHNHPSGDSTPSIQDIDVTNALFKIGNIMAIPVVDHIVFGNNEYYSFYEKLHNNNLKE